MVQTWFDTIDVDHGEQGRGDRRSWPSAAGSATADYKTLRRRHDDLHPGAEPGRVRPRQHPGATWTTRPTRSREFLVDTGLADEKPSLDGLLEPKFVQAVTRDDRHRDVDRPARGRPGLRRRCRGAGRPRPAAGAAGRHPGADPAGRARVVLIVLLGRWCRWPAWVAAGRPAGAVQPTRSCRRPPAVGRPGVEMARAGTLATDTWASVRRILVGFGLAVAGVGAAGHGDGRLSAPAQALFEPVVGLLRYLPASAFIPLLIDLAGHRRAVQDRCCCSSARSSSTR